MCVVSVLMPVFNGMPFIKDAVESIMNQTFTDFEFIIIDDGSTDETVKYLQSLNDSRLRIVYKEHHTGIGVILAEGVTLSKGDFIARIDADDIAFPDRLAKQVKCFKDEALLGLLGGSYEVFGEVSSRTIIKDSDDIDLRWAILLKNPFVHSSIMMRRAVLLEKKLNYAASLNQDYFLWADIMKYAKARITPDVVVRHRKHAKTLTATKSQLKMELQIKHVYHLITELTDDVPISKSDFSEFYQWLRKEHQSLSSLAICRFIGVYLFIFRAFVVKYKKEVNRDFFSYEFKRILKRFPKLFYGGLICWIINLKILLEIKIIGQSIKE